MCLIFGVISEGKEEKEEIEKIICNLFELEKHTGENKRKSLNTFMLLSKKQAENGRFSMNVMTSFYPPVLSGDLYMHFRFD